MIVRANFIDLWGIDSVDTVIEIDDATVYIHHLIYDSKVKCLLCLLPHLDDSLIEEIPIDGITRGVEI
jgi:hypothetical protein